MLSQRKYSAAYKLDAHLLLFICSCLERERGGGEGERERNKERNALEIHLVLFISAGYLKNKALRQAVSQMSSLFSQMVGPIPISFSSLVNKWFRGLENVSNQLDNQCLG